MIFHINHARFDISLDAALANYSFGAPRFASGDALLTDFFQIKVSSRAWVNSKSIFNRNSNLNLFATIKQR
jgi:hypothetical protein